MRLRPPFMAGPFAPQPGCSECPQAASLRPTASERAHRPRPTQPAAPGLAGGPPASAPAARPLAPHGSAGCRQRGCRLLASTASRSCTQRADEAPEVAADRSLSGRCRLRCSRPAEPRLLCAQRARGAAAPHATAPSHPLQPGGQRSHRTTEDRGSRQSASMSARHTRPYRRRRANAAAQRRSGLRQLSLTVGLADRRAGAEYTCNCGTVGSVGRPHRSKVQPPPLRGSDGLLKPSKVHGGEAP